jgi:hypothetical protein
MNAPAVTAPALRFPRVVLAAAALWGIGLLVAAFLLPVDRSETSSASSGSVDRTSTSLPQQAVTVSASSTLVQENGFGVLLPVGLPLLAVGVVAGTLHHRARRGRTTPGPLALTVTIAVVVLSVLALLSIGIFLLPIAVLLAVACSRAQGR